MNYNERTRKNEGKEFEKKSQKKSQKDMNGVIGGLVFGLLFAFVTHQIYTNFFEFPIGQILAYIVGFLAFICFMVSISCAFDYKESKKLRNWMKMPEEKKKSFRKLRLKKEL